jgi:DNA invertase Pin-like site-specific DNA recombinase
MQIGYVRSTGQPTPPYTQVTRLIAAGCTALYIEVSSGDHLDRPVLHRAIEDLQTGDVIVVADGDRLSRNELQTEILVRRIGARGATLRLLGPQDELLELPPGDGA